MRRTGTKNTPRLFIWGFLFIGMMTISVISCNDNPVDSCAVPDVRSKDALETDTIVTDAIVTDAPQYDMPLEDGKSVTGELCFACHAEKGARIMGGRHEFFKNTCTNCHENGRIHQADPGNVQASVDFSIERCGTCHADLMGSYLKDDGTKGGKYGGSIKTSKYNDFPHYIHLMGGHGFTKEYNEERAHKWMLKDHIDIQRKQNTVCLQCKSTPLAYYWNELRRGSYIFSKDMKWEDAVALIKEKWPQMADYGAGCTHCHDPHSTGFRLIRKAQILAIMERGTDPYAGELNFVPKTLQELEAKMNERNESGQLTVSAKRLAGTLTCAQCHVEYTCGLGIDKDKGILRDDFPWRKLRDIEAYYTVKYNLIQDWTHSGTGLSGIKAQHPETEFYWESPHYKLGNSCTDCHMGKDESGISHWLTSPLKEPAKTCGKCHANTESKVSGVIADQDTIFSQARQVEDLLDGVLTKIEAAKQESGFDPAVLTQAEELFMRSLLWWEFTVVSENSMGWHNSDEATGNLQKALEWATQADTLLGD